MKASTARRAAPVELARISELPRQGAGHLYHVTFYSGLATPPCGLHGLPIAWIHADAALPVYCLLHGMPGQAHVFIALARMDVARCVRAPAG